MRSLEGRGHRPRALRQAKPKGSPTASLSPLQLDGWNTIAQLVDLPEGLRRGKERQQQVGAAPKVGWTRTTGVASAPRVVRHGRARLGS